MLTKAKITIGNVLDNVMLWITKLLYDRAPNHKLTDFVLRYLHFDKISTMGERSFTTDYCKWAKKQGYILYERQAKEIFALAQNGIPALPMTASTTIVVKEAIKVVRELENSRAFILAQMQTFANYIDNIRQKWYNYFIETASIYIIFREFIGGKYGKYVY